MGGEGEWDGYGNASYVLVGKQRKMAAETERKTSSSLTELEMLSS